MHSKNSSLPRNQQRILRFDIKELFIKKKKDELTTTKFKTFTLEKISHEMD